VSSDDLFRHLGLPGEAIVDRKVPKSVLSESAGATPKDRRLIKEEVESLRWLAVLKPGTIGVRVFSDEETEYTELSVLTLRVRDAKRCTQLQDLVHRAIPYHTLLLTESPSMVSVSVAKKRRSRSEKDHYVLDDEVLWTEYEAPGSRGFEREFAVSMSLESVAPQTFRDLYLSWADSIVSLEAARITGGFMLSGSSDEAKARSVALREYQTSQREAESIRKKAKRESQASKRVELNLTLQDLRRTQDRAVRTLNPPETQSP
jgi:hypothetical protein